MKGNRIPALALHLLLRFHQIIYDNVVCAQYSDTSAIRDENK